jgi:hypothetical protein
LQNHYQALSINRTAAGGQQADAYAAGHIPYISDKEQQSLFNAMGSVKGKL